MAAMEIQIPLLVWGVMSPYPVDNMLTKAKYTVSRYSLMAGIKGLGPSLSIEKPFWSAQTEIQEFSTHLKQIVKH